MVRSGSDRLIQVVAFQDGCERVQTVKLSDPAAHCGWMHFGSFHFSLSWSPARFQHRLSNEDSVTPPPSRPLEGGGGWGGGGGGAASGAERRAGPSRAAAASSPLTDTDLLSSLGRGMGAGTRPATPIQRGTEADGGEETEVKKTEMKMMTAARW